MDEKDYGMSLEEIHDMTGFAKKLFEELKLDKLSPKDAFVIGFLQGRDFTLHQLGAYDDDDDDDLDIADAPEIIKQYLKYDEEK